jgi:hypothetical protein
MALILAVEPDRKQTALVKALAADRLSAELVIEESAERALRALGSRVPDLVLASPLLSWHDEQMLGDRLRELGDAAAHVQTVTIPILAATTRPTARKRGMLSALRGTRGSKATTDGCDLEVFAQQIREYLAGAARQQPVPVIDLAAEPQIRVVPEPVFAAVSEPVIEGAPEPIEPVVLELVVSGVVGPVDDGFALTAPTVDDFAWGASLYALPGEPDGFAPVGEALEAHPLLDFNALPDPIVEILPVVEPALLVAVEPDPAPWVDLSLEELIELPVHLEPVTVEPPAEEVWVLEPVADVPDILQPAATSVSVGPTSVNPGPTNVKPGPTSVGLGPTIDKKWKAPKRAKPAQDEWGFFDPAQCGFAALIAKLDQITDDDIELEGSVRVISSH